MNISWRITFLTKFIWQSYKLFHGFPIFSDYITYNNRFGKESIDKLIKRRNENKRSKCFYSHCNVTKVRIKVSTMIISWEFLNWPVQWMVMSVICWKSERELQLPRAGGHNLPKLFTMRRSFVSWEINEDSLYRFLINIPRLL